MGRDCTEVVETLVRQLVRTVGEDDQGTEPVLLDLEVDDVRCLVVRCARPSPMARLSPREREIARMVARGYPNKTIAAVLDISTWTVSSHLRRIFTKLRVSCRTAMVTQLSMEQSMEQLTSTDATDGEGVARIAELTRQ
jgi:DNA-binding CsgD family transcriptional regulator